MEVIELLKETKRLIKGGWTKNAYARLSDGRACSWGHKDAMCFSVDGALLHVTAGTTVDDWYLSEVAYRKARRLLEQGALIIQGRSATAFNDEPTRTKQDVIDLIDNAISRAENETGDSETF